MGAWGTALYSDDDALDFRDSYTVQLKLTGSHEQAYKAAYAEFQQNFGDAVIPEIEALFWFVIADRQWYYGNLLQEVKVKAFEFLKRTEHLEAWKNDIKQLSKRVAVLKALEDKLNSMPPVVRKIPKRIVCRQEIGDVFAIKIHKFDSLEERMEGYDSRKPFQRYRDNFEGKYFLFQIVGKNENRVSRDVYPLIRYFFWCGEEIPMMNEIQRFSTMPAPDSMTGVIELGTPRRNRVVDKNDDMFGVALLLCGNNDLKKHKIGAFPCAEIITNRLELPIRCYAWSLEFNFFVTYQDLKDMKYVP